MWRISLFIIGITTIINIFSSIYGVELPDILVRFIGIIIIAALPIFVYGSIKTLKNGNI